MPGVDRAGQVRTQYYRPFINDSVISSAYNLDITYAVWRSCFEGRDDLAQHGRAGPRLRGRRCLGLHRRLVLGRWYTSAANGYIASVQDYLAQRMWTTSDFANG